MSQITLNVYQAETVQKTIQKKRLTMRMIDSKLVKCLTIIISYLNFYSGLKMISLDF